MNVLCQKMFFSFSFLFSRKDSILDTIFNRIFLCFRHHHRRTTQTSGREPASVVLQAILLLVRVYHLPYFFAHLSKKVSKCHRLNFYFQNIPPKKDSNFSILPNISPTGNILL